MRSPQIFTFSIATSLVAEVTSVPFCTLRAGTARPLHAAIRRMKSGVVPQQPPMTETPMATNFSVQAANSSSERSYTVFPPTRRGRPLLGWTMTGSSVAANSLRTMGASSLGPSEQLTPSASTPSPSKSSATISGVEPVSVRPLPSKVAVANTGLSVCSLRASTHALSSYRSDKVSTI